MEESVGGNNTLLLGAADSRVQWVRVYDKRRNYREISDAVHGPIPIFPPLDRIIDTREFQRLRRLKQLNACSLVFPCAEHTRFTHSLGVYHLANSALQQLAERQPELPITGADQLCVCIVALVHDLGHGPFSHLYDGFFVKEVNPKSEWRHERGSVLILRLILDRYDEIRGELDRYLDKKDLIFIEELIDPPKKFMLDGEWQLKGRPPEKAFLYDFVSNVHSGTDVDKFDYFLRDSMLAPLSIGFDYRTVQRIFSHTRAVHDADLGYWRLAYDQKIVPDLRLVAEARIRLHQTVYQHKTAVAADILLVDALTRANDFIKFEAENGELYSISDAHKDMTAFLQLDDGVESVIRFSRDPRLNQAREILNRMDRRQLPRFVACARLNSADDWTSQSVRSAVSEVSQHAVNHENLIVRILNFHGGLGLGSDPLDNALLYDYELRPVKRDIQAIEGIGKQTGVKCAFVYVPFGTTQSVIEDVHNAITSFEGLKASAAMSKNV